MDFPIAFIIEDNPEFSAVIAGPLSREYSVQHFRSAEAALQQIENGRTPSVVISDVRLEQMSGLQLLQHLRERADGIPVILITGFADKQSVLSAVKYGAIDFLEKPFGLDRFREALEKAKMERDVRKFAKEIQSSYFHFSTTLSEFFRAYDRRLYLVEDELFSGESRPFSGKNEIRAEFLELVSRTEKFRREMTQTQLALDHLIKSIKTEWKVPSFGTVLTEPRTPEQTASADTDSANSD